jgi:UDP-N-acetylmuramoylalanine--D-glutamate ligase
MKIAIVGFDLDGRASYDYFASHYPEYELTICDQKAELEVPEGTQAVLGDSYLDNLDRFDLIMRTSGMHPRKILDKNPGVSAKISSNVNEFLKRSPTNNIIGVTGTKGKGTTSTLIARILEAGSKTVCLGGNIGLPPLTFIDDLDKDSWVVLELSSFQLIDLKQSPHVGVCLMVVPEHLDWHEDLDEYITAKEQLFARQVNGDVAIYFHDNETSQLIANAGEAQKVSYYHSPGAEVIDGAIVIDGTEICRVDQLKLLGQHNWQNACAAVTAVWFACLEVCGPADQQDTGAMREVLTSFSGLEHRLERVRELDGVTYYDDSFGTTPETTIVALQAFSQPKVVIMGGSTKNSSFEELAKVAAASNIRQVVLIGNTAHPVYTSASPLLESALRSAGVDAITSLVREGGCTMQEAVATARDQAQPGDVVLLSAGCASFDMFQNYKDRGDQFKQAVTNLTD